MFSSEFPSLRTVTVCSTGTLIGLIYGLGYHGLWAPLVQPHVDDIWTLPIQLVLGGVVGLIASRSPPWLVMN